MQAASKPLIGCLSESVRVSALAEIIASRIPKTKAVGERGAVEGRMVWTLQNGFDAGDWRMSEAFWFPAPDFRYEHILRRELESSIATSLVGF